MSPTVSALWSQAMTEAVTLANSNDVILHTLELRHPSFLSSAVRCVRDHGSLQIPGDPDIYGLMLFIEAGAPLDAGTNQLFVACMFDMSLPAQQDNPPSIEITIDNVTQVISEQLDAAIGTQEPIEITYREYLASIVGPQYILSGGVLQSVISTMNRVRATVVFTDFVNRNFPNKLYQPSDYVGLVR